MTFEEILPHVDHTLLAATATKGEIEKLCEEAEMYHTASVCVPSSFVKEIRERHPGLRICAVAGFPLGNMSKAAKVFESRQAVLDGADEIDIVLHIGALKDGNAEYVTDEIAAVKEAIGDHVLKVIIETCLLTEEEKILAFRDSCATQFGDGATLNPANLIDSSRFEVKTADATISVGPEHSYLVETRIIDGRKYLLIPADEDIEVNGFGVRVKGE